MISLGDNVDRFKLLAFVLSATLSDATWQMSGMVILMTLIGDMGTLTGPVLGAELWASSCTIGVCGAAKALVLQGTR